MMDLRSLLYLLAMPKALLTGAVLLLLAGCDAFSSGTQVSFSRLALPASPVLVNGTTVIRNPSQLESFARRQDGELATVSEVDFTRQLVVGVFYGGSFHGGCGGDVDVVEAVRTDGDALVVQIGPLPDLGPCRAIVHPAEMVVIDATAGRVRFVGEVPR